ncbi:MAG: sigma-70 family RNA polymerase sigma factor [Planctomycetota bacterium]
MATEHGANAPTQQLVAAAQGGDQAASGALLLRYLPALRAFVRLRSDHILRAREAESDLVQTACRQVLQNLDQFEWRDEGSFRHWLFALALNKIRNHRNMALAGKRDLRREVAGTHGDRELGDAYATLATPTRQLSSRDEVARIEKAIDSLPEGYREVVILSRVVGLTSAQIGERQGKSEGAVRVQLSRALARLAAALE